MSADVDAYIASFPPATQDVLREVRRRLHAQVPGAGEAMRYDIPTLTIDGRSVLHFAGWKQHLSLYPVPAGDEAFERDIAPYRSGASTAKFLLSKPIPYDLIERWAGVLRAQR